MNMDILDEIEKTYLNKQTVDKISYCNNNMITLRKYYENIGKSYLCPSAANFRDAIIHYNHQYYAVDNIDFFCQRYALDEHLQRCLKDACVFLSEQYLKILESILTYRDSDSFEEVFCSLEQKVPDLKNYLFWSATNIDIITKSFIKARSQSLGCKIENIKNPLYIAWKNEIKDILFLYFCNIENKRLDLKELRIIVHKIKDYSSKIRSSSTDLVKLYSEIEDGTVALDKFYHIIDDTYEYMKKHTLLGAFYLL